MKKQFTLAEENIAKTTKEKEKLENDLGLPEIYSDHQKFSETERKYNQVKSRLVKENKEYEVIFETLMELEEKWETASS